MSDITIPPGALEAAADELRTYFDTTHSQAFLRDIARAACLAMLTAWPGLSRVHRDWDGTALVCLPLPQAKNDE